MNALYLSNVDIIKVALWLLLVFGVPGSFAFLMLFQPLSVIRLQGKFYKRYYKDVVNMSDTDIDNAVQLPSDNFLIGRRSEFVRSASTEPEKFTRLIVIYRLLGIGVFALLFLGFGLFLLSITK